MAAKVSPARFVCVAKAGLQATGSSYTGVSVSCRMFATAGARMKAEDWCGKIFDAIDFNKNGYLDKDEVKKIVLCFGENHEQAELRWAKLLEHVDTNKDSKISRSEYVSYWKNQTSDKVEKDGGYSKDYEEYLANYIDLLKIKSQQHEQELADERRQDTDTDTAAAKSVIGGK